MKHTSKRSESTSPVASLVMTAIILAFGVGSAAMVFLGDDEQTPPMTVSHVASAEPEQTAEAAEQVSLSSASLRPLSEAPAEVLEAGLGARTSLESEQPQVQEELPSHVQADAQVAQPEPSQERIAGKEMSGTPAISATAGQLDSFVEKPQAVAQADPTSTEAQEAAALQPAVDSSDTAPTQPVKMSNTPATAKADIPEQVADARSSSAPSAPGQQDKANTQSKSQAASKAKAEPSSKRSKTADKASSKPAGKAAPAVVAETDKRTNKLASKPQSVKNGDESGQARSARTEQKPGAVAQAKPVAAPQRGEPVTRAKPSPQAQAESSPVMHAYPMAVVAQSPAGDRVWLRVGDQRTVIVDKGISVPGLGVFHGVSGEGAKFDSGYLPVPR